MMPSDSYRLYEVQRVKSTAEIRRADEQAAWLVAAVTQLVRGITRPVRSAQGTRPAPGPRPGIARTAVPRAAEPAGRQAG